MSRNHHLENCAFQLSVTNPVPRGKNPLFKAPDRGLSDASQFFIYTGDRIAEKLPFHSRQEPPLFSPNQGYNFGNAYHRKGHS
jgi:hypothetical protein